MLTRAQTAEIVAFDRAARARGRYDVRRYGTVSDYARMYRMSARVREADPFGGVPPKEDAPAPAAKALKPVRKTLRYNYVVPARTRKGGWQAREAKVYHVAVRLDRSYHPVVKVVAVYDPATRCVKWRDMGYHGIAGWIVYWDRKDYERKSVSAWACPAALGSWVEETAKRGTGLAFPYHETVNPEALAGTRYRYSQYVDGAGDGLCDWLALYRAEPMVETLAKAGLRHLATPYAVKRLHDEDLLKWVRAHLDGCRGAGIREISWAARHGRTLEEAAERSRFVESVKECRRWCRTDRLPKLDYDRLMKLVPKWGVEVREYCRYVGECVQAGLDLRNDGTLYPPVSGGRAAFLARLEALEAENERRRKREERIQAATRRRLKREAAALERERLAAEAKRFAVMFKDRMAELEAFQASAAQVATLSGEGVTVVVAKSQEELLKEGRRMGNCIGCGRYGRALMNGESVIVMVRGSDGKPYVDMEVDRASWRVKQCYCKGNSLAPAGMHRLGERIAKALKARHRADVKERLYPTLGFRAQKRMRREEVA